MEVRHVCRASALSRGQKMDEVAEYIRRAEECAELARNMHSEEQRRKMLELARTWRALAEQRQESLKRTGRWRKAPH